MLELQWTTYIAVINKQKLQFPDVSELWTMHCPDPKCLFLLFKFTVSEAGISGTNAAV